MNLKVVWSPEVIEREISRASPEFTQPQSCLWLITGHPSLVTSTCLSAGLLLQYTYGFAGCCALRDGEEAMVDTLWRAIRDFAQRQLTSTGIGLMPFRSHGHRGSG